MSEEDLKNLIKHSGHKWDKICQLIEEFHVSKQAERGISKSGRPNGEKQGWGIRDTARELGLSIGRVSEDLLLSRNGRIDSSLFEIGDRKVALKKVKE